MDNQTTGAVLAGNLRASIVTRMTSEIWTPTSTDVMVNISGELFNLSRLIDPKTNSEQSDDAIWILTSTFIIFTMQSGFGLLESGSVSTKNEANIMVKNAMDVIFGGFTYWVFGYAFSFGEGAWTTGFNGWGNFVAEIDEADMGEIYSKFFFQSSFATTATTIVSGSMAERTKLESYILFSTINTVVYCFPAHWVWAPTGWLNRLGMIDIAGAGPVHLCGGMTGLVATVLLKPRHKRYDSDTPPQMGSPTNALLGTFMLWWGWLGFNCGSTFGISGAKWKLAARSAITTLISSCAGGMLSALISYIFKKRMFDITYIINGLLGSLVGITAFCALSTPWESFIIGLVGAAVAISAVEVVDKLKIDDPVGCVGVHGIGAMWGLLCVGLFAKKDPLNASLGLPTDRAGLFYGGGFYLLGVQALAIVVISTWTIVVSFLLLKAIDLTIGLRVPLEDELLGADIVEHGLGEVNYSKSAGSGRERHLVARESKGVTSTIARALEEGGVTSLVLSSANSIPAELNSFSHRNKTGAFGAKRGASGPTAQDLQEVAALEGLSTSNNVHVHVVTAASPTSQKRGGRRVGRVFSRLFRRRRKYTANSGNSGKTLNGGIHEMTENVATISATKTGSDETMGTDVTQTDGNDVSSERVVTVHKHVNGTSPNRTSPNVSNGGTPEHMVTKVTDSIATIHDGQKNDGFRSDNDVR